MKKILVVIDMQNDFIDGALGTAEAKALAPALVKKVTEFKGPVIFTRDTHGEDYLETLEGKNLPVQHCIYGSEGWNLLSELDQYARDNHCMIFDKPTFGSTQLAGFVSGVDRMTHIDEIELIGVCTDICVITNALLLKTALPETTITVNASYCAGVTPQSHLTALEAMKACQIKVISDQEA